MATILKGYRGQSNPEDPIKSITKTYAGGTDPEETEAEEAKYKALVAKAEEKGWSDKKRIRKGVDANPKDFLPSNTKAVFKKGEWASTRKKWGGDLRNEETGKVKKPHISIEKTAVESTRSPQGRPNPFYGMSTKNKIKNRLAGFGPKSEHWKKGFQTDHSPATPYQETKGKYGKLPTGKTKTKRKINIDWD